MSNQKLDPIAEKPLAKTIIARGCDYIHREDALRFRRKLEAQREDESQFTHTIHELVLGAFLCREGLPARSEWKIENETPDWSIIDDGVKGIVELVNVHAAKETEKKIDTALELERKWIGWSGPAGDRLYPRIQEKAIAYREIRNRLAVPYAVAVFGIFTAGVILQHVEECVNEEPHGLFKLYPDLSGVVFIDESLAGYRFHYLANTAAQRPWRLPEGCINLFN